MPATYELTKSRFLAGVQCHKQLWWRVHEPDARELAPNLALQLRFDQGQEVERVARSHVPGGELIDIPFFEPDRRIAATLAALERGAPLVYGATFLADDTYVVVDMLARRGSSYTVIEVKQSTKVKDEHIPDLAVQVHVARRSGLTVERAEVMHLNRECRHPDLSNLFVRQDVTGLVETYLLEVPDEIAAQLAMLGGPLPPVPIGEHCTRPHECPFIDRCWTLPNDHVSTLYRIDWSKAAQYEANGYSTIHDLPTDLELSVIHRRQIKAVTSGRMVVERTLEQALGQFQAPLAYLDFETVSRPIPVWPGCRPWEIVPVQFSVHVERGGKLEHHAFLAEGPDDPRPAIAEALVAACAGARRVVAYYASFERDCIRHLAEAVPQHARELRRIERRLVDLLPAVRNHIYHPDFGGSFSIKAVLPALVPGLSYDDLPIHEGELASAQLTRLLFKEGEIPPAERAELRRHLLRYCERDSWAMVQLLDRLRGLVGVQLELF